MKKVICNIEANKEIEKDPSFLSAYSLRESIYNLIKKDYPDFNRSCYIAKDEVMKYKKKYLEDIVNKEDNNEYDNFDKNVIDSILKQNTISENFEDDLEDSLTLGQKIADKVAKFGGSWTFINSFGIFLFLWMAVNVWVLVAHPFDPYPFILLNLFLSTLAAIQAPIIMMSQNRQEDKDRKRSEKDYKINLKAELEIKLLHEKIDHIISYQNKKLIETMEQNSYYLKEISELLKNGKK